MRCGRVLVTLAVLGMCAAGLSAGIAGSDHDFSGSGWSKGEVCLPCHTPHASEKAMGYLWNHQYPSDADFQTHEGAILLGSSLTCLSCHDGVIAIDSVGGATGQTTIGGKENIGRDLVDDHPVGIGYGSSSRRAPVGVIWGGQQPGIESANLPLFGVNNQVECSTCHTPHDDTNGSFLRASNASSALCTACHTAQ